MNIEKLYILFQKLYGILEITDIHNTTLEVPIAIEHTKKESLECAVLFVYW